MDQINKDALAPIDRHALEGTKRKWAAALAALETAPCTTANEAEWAAWAAAAQTALREIEDSRTEITKPVNAELRQINAYFRGVAEPPESVKTLVKRRLAGLALERDAAARAERAAALAAQTAPEAPAPIVAPEPEAPPPAAGIRRSLTWTPVVVDAAAVPREWLGVDIDRLVELGHKERDLDVPTAIPGIEWRREASVSATGRGR